MHTLLRAVRLCIARNHTRAHTLAHIHIHIYTHRALQSLHAQRDRKDALTQTLFFLYVSSFYFLHTSKKLSKKPEGTTHTPLRAPIEYARFMREKKEYGGTIRGAGGQGNEEGFSRC